MQGLLRTNKFGIPYNSSFVQTNKAFRWAVNEQFYYSALTLRDTEGVSKANRTEIENIKSFTLLSSDWDGYGAVPISPEAMGKAITFILDINRFDMNAYLSSPGPNGEVLVQIKLHNREIECIFYDDKSKYVLFKNNNFESQGTYFPNILPELISWLTANG